MRQRLSEPRRRSRRAPARRPTARDDGAEPGLVGLQRAAGNAAVSALLQRSPDTGAATDPARLDIIDAEESVRAFHRLRLDDASIRALQDAIGTPSTGTFAVADARALSSYQVAHGLRRGGTYDYSRFGRATLDRIVADRVAVGMEEEMIHLVVDYDKVDTGKDTLSVRFDSSLSADSSVSFEADTLRRIALGPGAMTSSRTIRAEIRKQLGPEAPAAFLSHGATPAVLTEEEAASAADANAGALTDSRALLAVQGVLGAPATGTSDPATAQFIAQDQRVRGLSTKDGTIDDEYFHRIVDLLAGNSDFEALVRLVVDYRHLDLPSVIDVSFDPALDPARDYRIVSAGTGSAMSIVFGPAGIAGGTTAPSIVHTLARAYAEARLRLERRGQMSREFLAFKADLMSAGMTEEVAGFFFAKAVQALDRFRGLDRGERVELWASFEELRQKAEERFARASAGEQAAFESIVLDYRSETGP